jgi:hypothetical protein
MFLDLHAPFDAPLTSATPPVRVSTPELNEAASRAMGEPGIFKGCRGTDGPLPAATKDAILAYLGKPNAESWERLRQRAVVGRTTLGEAWTLSNPGAARRFPNSAELIRAMRVAVISQWAGMAATLGHRH